MGSATIEKAQPTMAGTTDMKKITKIFKEVKLFFTKDNKKRKLKNIGENVEIEEERTQETPKTTVEAVLSNFRSLKIENKSDDSGDDDLKQFTYKVVDDECRGERIDSQSSEDSGFAEKNDDKEETENENEKDDLSDTLANLKIDEKKKKLQTVVVARTPIRQRTDYSAITRPYPEGFKAGTSLDSSRQINQVNRQFLSGGQIIENPNNLRPIDNYSEVVDALQQVEETTKNAENEGGIEWLLASLNDIIQRDTDSNLLEFDEIKQTNDGNINYDGKDITFTYDTKDTFTYNNDQNDSKIFGGSSKDVSYINDAKFGVYELSNPIEEFTNINHLNSENDIVDINNDVITQIQNEIFYYPTPPHSENISSPISDQSMYRPISEYTLSPERSSPIYNSDCEVFQEINSEIDSEYPVFVSNDDDTKKRDRTPSTKWHLKQYKDLQKEISNGFSKKDCCVKDRKPCKLIYQDYMQKLKKEEKMNLCFKVANLDLKGAYGVLHHVMLSLSQGSDLEDFQHALFGLICEKLLAQKPAVFTGQFGLNLLKAAVLRCHRRPLFARTIVYCIRTAIANEPSLVENRDSVFHEVDMQGDTLLIACARVGDACADCLSEIVRRNDEQIPLFRLRHVNADGMSALHVACSEHSPTSPRLHIVHVLLEHAGADLWVGDKKSDDNALHLAVKSKSCDLHLVMLLFKHVDRKLWKKLAHKQNMCLKSPLEYAREASRSPSNENRPLDVLEFLRKCRN